MHPVTLGETFPNNWANSRDSIYPICPITCPATAPPSRSKLRKLDSDQYNVSTLTWISGLNRGVVAQFILDIKMIYHALHEFDVNNIFN